MAGNDILERAALALANSQGGPIDSLDELDDDFRAGLIEDVRAVLGALWQPIETAPRDESRILIAMDLRLGEVDVREGRWNIEQGLFTSTNGFLRFDSATHWQPLPEAPE